MSQVDLYRICGDEIPRYIIKYNDGTIKVVTNWDLYLANTK